MEKRFMAAAIGLMMAATVQAGMPEALEAYGKGDYDSAVATFRSEAEAGNGEAQRLLGDLYSIGRGVAQDYAQAAQWYAKAAEQGDAAAQTALSIAYDQGLGVAKDPARSLEWLMKAAKQGDPDAQYRLGARYASGDGVAQDDARAFAWLTVSQVRGHHLAKMAREAIAERLSEEQQKEARRLSVELAHQYGKHY